MKYKVSEDNNVSTVFLNGEIDMDIADSVREVVFPLIDAGKEVHLNLKDVQYMDSSGISVIIESNQRAKKKNTKVELKEVSQTCRKSFSNGKEIFMTYKVTEEGDTSTVFLDGEIDMDKTEGAKEVIFPLIDAGKNVNLNLSNVQYMDSSGISVLIESHQKALEKGTKLIVKDVSKSVLKVIMMAN